MNDAKLQCQEYGGIYVSLLLLFIKIEFISKLDKGCCYLPDSPAEIIVHLAMTAAFIVN